jgi:perosamine synthetase
MCVDEIESKITSRTKAIMVVHIYGLPVDMDPIIELVKKYDLLLIEDAAEVIGQEYRGKPCGSFGNISTFSFYPNKHITTGEGGMILTDDIKLAQKCREIRNLSFIPPRRFIHEELGWNYRMSNLQAALGVAQLERLDEFIIKKRQIGEWYNSLLNGITGLQLPLAKVDYSNNIYWVYGLLINKDININAVDIMQQLGEFGIGSRPFFYSMHNQPVFKKMGLFKNVKLPNSDYLSEKGFYIPSGLGLTFDQAVFVSEKLRAIMLNAI